MTTYVLRNGVLYEKSKAPPLNYKREAPGVISDVMDPLKHHATGAIIDSKARFREHTRISGCLEVGTDPAASRPMPKYDVSETEIVSEVKRALQEVNSR